ncbi:ArpU family phage packaging/lysis transcriptional regulator [Oenococcus oeni]|uniref:ArpU family phage packaging/lysis transcriptional regulator n=1 Tax=Oenococcus oeni TaxID=1247 RepID=UPI0010B7C5B3|nr:ArpU family phage packaging/lysis transcriptional regulator [Oenococcus oeni]SYW19500.1 putative ArpU family transcriptional regulator [Oenococcus oeni]
MHYKRGDLQVDDIDDKATQERVRSFFKTSFNKPSQFERLVARAGGSISDLKSPQWSDMPSTKSADNMQELKHERYMQFQDEFHACIYAIKHIPDRYRLIFVNYYVDNIYKDKNWTDVANSLGMSRSQANETMNKALLLFADNYHGREDFHIKDFHVYLKPGQYSDESRLLFGR